jgi:NitT/TauT family transport system substrate-binding protein
MKRISPFIIALIICMYLAATGLCGCAAKPSEPALPRLNVAFQEWAGYGPFYLAKEKGFFEEEGVNVTLIDERLDSDRRDAFLSGMLDCEAAAFDTLISKVAQGVPLVAVMKIDSSYGCDAIVADKNISKLEDLIGKRVALARNDVGEGFIAGLFYEKTLLFDGVMTVPVQPNEAAKTFVNGGADACVTSGPYISEALQRPGAHVLADTRSHPNAVVNTLNVRSDLLEKDPGLIKKLMRGWFRAVKYYKEHPDESSYIISGYYRMSPEEYRKRVSGLKWYDHEGQKPEDRQREWLDAARVLVEVKLMNGRIPKRLDVSKLIDRTLIEGLYEDSK